MMQSKGKIIEVFTKAYERLAELSLPDGANMHLQQMHRAFTELRHHDSAQAKIVEETQAGLAARDKRMTELQREAANALEASRAKDARVISQSARIAGLENEVNTLAILIRKRLMPSSDEELEKRDKALEHRLEAIAREFLDDCKPTPAAQRAFHRCGLVIVNQCSRDLQEMAEALDTYERLVFAACLQHGPLTLPASLPDEVWENSTIQFVKLEDGGWSATVSAAEKSPCNERKAECPS